MENTNQITINGHAGVVNYHDGSYDDIFMSGTMKEINNNIIAWFTNKQSLVMTHIEHRCNNGVYLAENMELEIGYGNSNNITIDIRSEKVMVLGYVAYSDLLNYQVCPIQ